MFKKQILLNVLFIFTCFGYVQSQKVWNLQSCIDYALENNVAVKQSSLNIDYAANNLLLDKMDLYTPNANLDVSHNFNFSASLNPLTYEFIRENTQSTRMGITGNYVLFNGLNRLNSISASEDDLTASTLEVEEVKNNTKLLVANYYLQILVASEVQQVAYQKLSLTEVQFNNTQELVKAGLRANGDLLEVESQMANDELAIVNAENNLQKALNQLKILLQINPYEEMQIEGINVETVEENVINPQIVMSRALDIMPSINGAKYRMEAAKKSLKASKGLISPTLSVSAYLGTNYFSAAQEVVGEENLGNLPIGIVNGSNQLVTSITPFSQPLLGDLSFGQQFSQNMNQNVSINLSIPLFGKWQRMIAISNAKINVLQTELGIEAKQNELQQEILNAYTDMVGAQKKFEAADKSLIAAQQAFDYANEKFKAGLMNSLEFETAKNRLIASQAEVIQSKYEYAFRRMIVNFYQTGNIEL